MNTSCYCPVTRRHFNAVVRQFDYIGGATFAWFRCPFCDRFGRTNTDIGYNARYAQWHRQQIDAKMPVPADTIAVPPRTQNAERLSLVFDKRLSK